jgi:hypothetical protein
MSTLTLPSPGEVLAGLVEEQRRDDLADRVRLPWDRTMVNASSLDGPDADRPFLDSLADPGAFDPAEVLEASELIDLADPEALLAYRKRARSLVGPKLLGLSAPWYGPELEYPGGSAPCPAHPGGPPPRGSTCIICSASYDDPKPHPMKPVPRRRGAGRWPATTARGKGKGKGRKGQPAPVVAGLAGGTGKVAIARPIAV